MKHRSAAIRWSNPTESLDEMQRHLRGEPEQFGCLGGHKYFYLDWHLEPLPLPRHGTNPCASVYEWDDSKLIRDGCTRCMIDCYRDPSVLQHVAINVSDAWQAFKRRDLGTVAMKLLDSEERDFTPGRVGGPEVGLGKCRAEVEDESEGEGQKDYRPSALDQKVPLSVCLRFAGARFFHDCRP
jgi:hypothetical protein